MVAGSPRTVIAAHDLVRHAESSAAWIGGAGTTVVDADADYPVERLERDLPGERHRNTGLTEAKGRIERRFGAAKSVGAAALVDHNLTQNGQVRFIGGDYVFADSLILDGTAPNTLVSTTANLTAGDAATFRIVCLHRPIDGATDRNAETWFYFGTDPTSDSLFDVALQFRGTGNVGVRCRVARYSGSHIDLVFSTAEIDDGIPREYIITVDDSDTSAELYVDGTLADSSSSAPAFGAGASQEISIGTAPCRMEIFSVTRIESKVATADFADLRRYGSKPWDALPHWDMSGTAAVVDDLSSGSHTGTVGGSTVRGVEIAESVAPLVDSSTTPAWGDYQTRQALRLGSTGNVSFSVSSNLPRSMTASFWVRIFASRIDMSQTRRYFWAGASAGTADIEMRTATDNWQVVCRRTSIVGKNLVTNINDGEWHFIRITLDGRALDLDVWVDGTFQNNTTVNAYVSAASWSVNILGSTDAPAGVDFADVRVYGFVRGSTSIDYQPSIPPWDDRELLVELPLDAVYTETRSLTAASTSGTLSFVEFAQQNPDPAPIPGAAQGRMPAADLLSQLPALCARDFSIPALCEEGAALRWDPLHPDAYLEAGALRFFAVESTAAGRQYGSQSTVHFPESRILPGGAAETQLGERGISFEAEWPALDLNERDDLIAAFRRVGTELPILLISIIWDDDQRLLHSVWGVVRGKFTAVEIPTDTRGRFRGSVNIRSLMQEPLRLGP